jgi:o-succinylbenzoate---CoA ligase
LVSAVPITDVTGSLGGATAAAAMEPVSAPDDIALICFTSGEKTRLLQNE